MSSRILLVEDSPVTLEVIASHMDDWGYSVVTSDSGEGALRIVAEDDIDLVVTDLGLPTMSGLELLTEIRRRAPMIPVIVLSGDADRGTVLEAVHLGASDFVGKTEHPSLLQAAIRRTLERLQLTRDNRGLIEELRGINAELESQVLERTKALEQANDKLRAEMGERQRVELELRLAQKLETVGRLAAGVAHEINTPIQFVSDSTYFAKGAMAELSALIVRYRACLSSLRNGEVVTEACLAELGAAEQEADIEYLLENVPTALDRALVGLGSVANIVKSMKQFAHPGEREHTAVDLKSAIESTLSVARSEYKYVAEVETHFGDLPPVSCFAGELNQVILNLVVNAAHAIGDVMKERGHKGRLTVRTRREGDKAVIEIGDTGGGIPESIRERIFDPFFTTKEVGKGTGQGLAIARAVVERHGGNMTFETEMGRGTRFFIRLPFGEEMPKVNVDAA